MTQTEINMKSIKIYAVKDYKTGDYIILSQKKPRLTEMFSLCYCGKFLDDNEDIVEANGLLQAVEKYKFKEWESFYYNECLCIVLNYPSDDVYKFFASKVLNKTHCYEYEVVPYGEGDYNDCWLITFSYGTVLYIGNKPHIGEYEDSAYYVPNFIVDTDRVFNKLTRVSIKEKKKKEL